MPPYKEHGRRAGVPRFPFRFSSYPMLFFLRLGCALLAALSLTACRSEGAPAADPPSDSLAVAAPSPDPPATDGGEVLMPEAVQSRLIAEDSLWAEALRIHYNAIVFDGHVDVPLLMMRDYDMGLRHDSAHVDLPRMAEGGLDAAFFSIFVSTYYGEGNEARRTALWMIQEVERQLRRASDRAELARTAADVRRITRDGKKAVLLGLEGGHALMGSTEVLRELQERGVRYVTLTHTGSHGWADSSQDSARWGGLNDTGRALVEEMNRLGVLVDLSHVSDSTFWDALAVTRAPVIVSHSSARALVDNVRNLDDAMLRAVADNGGIVMVNFYDLVVDAALTPDVMAEVYRRTGGPGSPGLKNLWEAIRAVRAERGLGRGTLEDVVDHIDYVARVAGIDHVGLGSDFDGAAMPAGLGDATRLPWITYHLLKRGYTEDELYKILGGNALRVLEAAERVAAEG